MSTFTLTTVEQMQAELSSLPADEDLTTQRERDRNAERRQNLTWRIGDVRNMQRDLAKYEPEFLTLTKWVDDLTRLRQVIAAKLLAAADTVATEADTVVSGATDPSMAAAGKISYERRSLKARTVQEQFSLIKIDRGFDMYEATPVNLMIDDLLVAEGYERGIWHGSLPYAIRRLGELTKRRAEAQKSIEQSLREYV